jgi:hypothetical protein
VVIALGASWLLGQCMSDPDHMVAVGMVVVTAVAGPRLHPYLLGPREEETRPAGIPAPTRPGDVGQ